MWLKFTKSILILVFLSICLTVTGCVDEPTIEPVIRPFSVTRIGNFSDNVATINLSIDGQPAIAIQKNTLTGYFDIKSGKRVFLVTNAANGDTLFYKEIEFISYEESSVYFGGYFSKDILENTFSPFYQPEGDTYVAEQPKSGKTLVYFADMSSDIVKDGINVFAKKFQINAVVTPAGKADTLINFTSSTTPLEFGKMTGAEIPAGTIKVSVVNNDNSAEALAQYEGTIDPGLRYFFYLNLTGSKPVVTLVPDKQIILPVRQK